MQFLIFQKVHAVKFDLSHIEQLMGNASLKLNLMNYLF